MELGKDIGLIICVQEILFVISNYKTGDSKNFECVSGTFNAYIICT
jgi:hypothetical protein